MARWRALFGWNDAIRDHAGSSPSRGAWLATALLALPILGLQVRAIAGPHEDWPFSSGPMFARYHDPDWPLFELVLQAEVAPGVERPIDPTLDLGIGEIALKRLLFANYYGSIDPKHPAGHHEHDSPEQFRNRLEEFCRRAARVFSEKNGIRPRSIRLEVKRIAQQRDARGVLRVRGVTEQRTIFVYDVTEGVERSQ